MKPRILAAFSCLVALALFFPSVSTLSAQDGFRSVDRVELTDVTSVLHRGAQLEEQLRWGEALNHYEEAARRFPQNELLKDRVVLARLHFDLSRRYGDQSYLTTLSAISEQQALDLYGEVTAKIQSHYVHEPDWNDLLKRGTASLRIALSDSAFVEIHHARTDAAKSEQLLRYIEQVLGQRNVRDGRQAQELVRWIGQLVARQLKVPANAVVLEYMCGATSALDPYSTYLTADQLDEVYSQIEGNFVGLGIELKGNSGTLLIAHVISGGPAQRAGILAGERIVEVDGVSTRELTTDRAADLLKGEQGTYVQLGLESSQGEVRRLHVRRERVEVPSVEDVRMLDGETGVAYFRISSFQKTTSRDVDAALWKLHREGMRSLIVDVRGNPGGLLNEAVEVADRFVVDGTIVATHGRSVRENYDYKAHRVGTWRVPLVVLIDGDSASASEIFAGAIRDHRRGTVVGDSSYGKGSVQGIFPLRTTRAGVRLTTAKFYSPSGRAISDGGVEPDVRVQTVQKPVELADSSPNGAAAEQDAVLVAGTRIARQLVAARLAPSNDANRSAQVDSRRNLERSGRGR